MRRASVGSGRRPRQVRSPPPPRASPSRGRSRPIRRGPGDPKRTPPCIRHAPGEADSP
jgi:hypothetical protein